MTFDYVVISDFSQGKKRNAGYAFVVRCPEGTKRGSGEFHNGARRSFIGEMVAITKALDTIPDQAIVLIKTDDNGYLKSRLRLSALRKHEMRLNVTWLFVPRNKRCEDYQWCHRAARLAAGRYVNPKSGATP